MKVKALVVVGALLLATAALAGTGKNVLGEIQVKERAEGTLITIAGSTTPTFSVFRLADPPRLFVDIAGGDISRVARTVEVFNGVVAQVGTIAFGESGVETARVIVTFEREAAYDVQSRGDEILILIDGEGRTDADAQAEAAEREREHLEKAIERERSLLFQLRGAREREEELKRQAEQARNDEQELIQTLEAERTRLEALRSKAETRRIEAQELSEVAEAERARAEEERKAAERLAKLEKEKLGTLKTERERMEEMRQASAAAAAASVERRRAEERAAQLADQKAAAIEEERKRAEQLKVAVNAELVRKKEKLALAEQKLRLEQEKAEALAEARRMEERKKKIAADARKQEEVMLTRAIEARREQERLAAELKTVTKEARRLQLEAERNAQERRLAEIEKEKVAADKARLAGEAAAEEARLAALKDATTKEAELKRKLEAQRKNREQLDAVAQEKLEATEAKLAAARLAVQREEERRAAVNEAAEREEIRLAAVREAALRKAAHEKAMVEKAAVEKALAAAREARTRAATEKERLAAVIAARTAEERMLEETRAGKARVEAERIAAAGELAAVQARLDKIEAGRAKKHALLGKIRAEIGEQRQTIEAVNAQLVLEQENLARMVAQRKSEEKRLEELRSNILALEAKKDGVETSRIKALRKELAGKEEVLREREELLGGLQERLSALEAEAAAAPMERARSEALATQLEARKRDVEWLTQRYENTRDKLADLRKEGAARKQAAARLESDVAKTNAELEEMRRSYQALLTERKKWAEKADEKTERTRSLSSEVEGARSRIVALQTERDRKVGELSTLNEQIEVHAAVEARLREELAEARGAAAARSAEAGALRGEVARQKKDLDALRAALVAREEHVAALRSKVEEASSTDSVRVKRLKEKLAASEQELARFKERIETATASTDAALKAMAKRLDDRKAELEQVNVRMAAELRRAAVAKAEADAAAREAVMVAEQARAKAREAVDAAAKVKAEAEARTNTEVAARSKAEARAVAVMKAAAAEKAEALETAARVRAEADTKAREAMAAAEQARARAREAAEAAAKVKAEARAQAKTQIYEAVLKDVRFDGEGGASVVRLIKDGDVSTRIVRKGDRDLVMVVEGMRIPSVLERTLDTSDFGGPVAWVSSYRNPAKKGGTVVSVHLNKPVTHRLVEKDSVIEWRFGTADAAPQAARSAPRAVPRSAPAGVGYHPQGVGAGTSPAGAPTAGIAPSVSDSPFAVLNPRPKKKKKKYTGRHINLAIKDANIQHVLAFLARVGGVNIVTSDKVKGTVSFYLEDVPWDLALDMILKTSGMDYVKEEGIYRVAPVADIQKEYELQLDKKKKITELKQLQVKLIPVNYAEAKSMMSQVGSILSSKGEVSVDDRTNTIIVKDIEEHVLAVDDLVRRLDAQTPQVLIEARIVEASSDFSKQVGVQWGGGGLASVATNNETGLVFPSTIGLAGGAAGGQSNSEGLYATETPNYAVNLPAAAGQGAGGAIGLTMGSIGQAANLYLRLSAAEEEGMVKIVSAPRITTVDNTQARIQQGVSFPVSVVSAQGVNTQFFDANLSLDVTPHVTQDGNIQLKIDIRKNEPDFSQVGANGNPTIRKKEAHTELLLKDGDTTVIGGIFARSTTKNYKRIPFFADLPLLGWFFRNTNETERRSEMLIFITPRIVNRQASKVKLTGD